MSFDYSQPHKIVDGEPVLLSAEELADQKARDAAFTAAMPPRQAEAARIAAIDAAISGDTTVAQLKAMTAAEFDTWWAANVTNAAQAINVLKRIARVVIRRVL